MVHRVAKSWIRVKQPSMHAHVSTEIGILHNFHIIDYVLLNFSQLIKKKKERKEKSFLANRP